MATGARNQQTGRAGEHFVAAELNRRGAYAVTFAGNMPKIDILASNLERTRTVHIQVKTRRSGTWQTSVDEGRKGKRSSNETNFWIFVNLHLPGQFLSQTGQCQVETFGDDIALEVPEFLDEFQHG